MQDNFKDFLDPLQSTKHVFQMFEDHFSDNEKELFAYFVDNYDAIIEFEKSNGVSGKIDPVKKDEAKKLLLKLCRLFQQKLINLKEEHDNLVKESKQLINENKKLRAEEQRLRKERNALLKKAHLKKLFQK